MKFVIETEFAAKNEFNFEKKTQGSSTLKSLINTQKEKKEIEFQKKRFMIFIIG